VLEARAKINLYLEVFPRVSEGYHPIRTLFQTVALSDRLAAEEIESPTVFSAHYDPDLTFHPELQWSDGNLLYEAFEAIEMAIGHPCGRWKFDLQKRIPAQSGLGGGSADAAALIRWLSRKFGLNPRTEQAVAKQVGADVPFLLENGTALGEGNGSALSPLPLLPPLPVLIVQPPFTMSTTKMYEQYDHIVSKSAHALNGEGEQSPQSPLQVYEALKSQYPVDSRNDFEAVAWEYYPEYRVFLNFFSRLGKDEGSEDPSILLKRMSGSGSAHYIVFRSETDRAVLAHYESVCRNHRCWAVLTRFSGGVMV